jgi:DNA-directed RNA polymerase specialized sigma24 family protein
MTSHPAGDGARDPAAHLGERLGSRDPEALGLAFDHFGPKVYAFLARIEPDPDALDLLVEEVFWTLWAAAGRSGGETDVERLLREAMGSCLRRRRHTAHRKEQRA